VAAIRQSRASCSDLIALGQGIRAVRQLPVQIGAMSVPGMWVCPGVAVFVVAGQSLHLGFSAVGGQDHRAGLNTAGAASGTWLVGFASSLAAERAGPSGRRATVTPPRHRNIGGSHEASPLAFGGIFFQGQKDAPALAGPGTRVISESMSRRGAEGPRSPGPTRDGKPTGGNDRVVDCVGRKSDQFAPSKGLVHGQTTASKTFTLWSRAAQGGKAATSSTKIDDSEYGKFGWVIDPEGNKVELCANHLRVNETRPPPVTSPPAHHPVLDPDRAGDPV